MKWGAGKFTRVCNVLRHKFDTKNLFINRLRCQPTLATSPSAAASAVAAWRIGIDLYLEAALLLSLLPLLPNGGERLRGLRVEALRRGAVLRSGLSRRPQPTLDTAQPRGLGVAAHRQEEGRRCRDQE